MLRIIGAIVLAFFLLRAAPVAYPFLLYSAAAGALMGYGHAISSLDIHRHFDYTVSLLLRSLQYANCSIP